jgi:hypothetical protein
MVFTDMPYNVRIAGHAGIDDKEDALPAIDPARPTVCVKGDLWIAGHHRILCGDALERGSNRTRRRSSRSSASGRGRPSRSRPWNCSGLPRERSCRKELNMKPINPSARSAEPARVACSGRRTGNKAGSISNLARTETALAPPLFVPSTHLDLARLCFLRFRQDQRHHSIL